MNDRTEVIRAARKRLERLSKTLTEQKEGLLQGKPSNASEVCRQIVAFVDTLDRIEGARDELQKRASLVYRHCGPASPFAAARDRFVEFYTEHTRDVEPVVPKNSSRAHALASLKALLLTPGPGTEEAIVSDRVHSLVSLATSVSHLSVLHHCLEEIDRLWPWIELNAPEAIVPLRNWRLICHEIQRQSYDGEVEGCLRLWEIATADKADPSDITRMVKSLATEPNAGQEMVQAAHDLLAWAEQQQTRSIDSEALEQRHPQQSPDDQVPSSRKTVPGKRTRGRRKAGKTSHTQTEELLIAALTKHHEYDSGSCGNLEPIKCRELVRFAGLGSPASASKFFKKQFGSHDQYSQMCQTPERLVAAMKSLNGEIAPKDFYSARTPDEFAEDE